MCKREIKFCAWDNILKEILPNVQNHINGDWAFGVILKNTERWTILEYTGLRDIKKKEIYEGFTLQTKYYTGVVVFDEGCFCLKVTEERLKNKGYDVGQLIPLFDLTKPLIIGNIYKKALPSKQV